MSKPSLRHADLIRSGRRPPAAAIHPCSQPNSSFSLVYYAFVKRWDKVLQIGSLTSSVGSGWGSHPIAFSKKHKTWTTEQGSWCFLPPLIFTPLPKSKSHSMEEKSIQKLGHMDRRSPHFASGAISKSSTLWKYEKGVGNTEVMEKRSPTGPSSPYAAPRSFASSTQTWSHLRILADLIPLALVRALGWRLKSEYQVKDTKRSHNWKIVIIQTSKYINSENSKLRLM